MQLHSGVIFQYLSAKAFNTVILMQITCPIHTHLIAAATLNYREIPFSQYKIRFSTDGICEACQAALDKRADWDLSYVRGNRGGRAATKWRLFLSKRTLELRSLNSLGADIITFHNDVALHVNSK